MSVEEKVEEHYKAILDGLGVRHYGKTEKINDSIAKALKDADSKSGGSGNNFPDIQMYLEDGYGRGLPVMVEAKGSKRKACKTGCQDWRDRRRNRISVRYEKT